MLTGGAQCDQEEWCYGFYGCRRGTEERRWDRVFHEQQMVSKYHFLRVPLPRLDNAKILKIVQVYASTTASDDYEVEESYDELDSALIAKSTYTVVMGYFNTRLGREGKPGRYIGKFGIRERNERGDMMASMVEASKLFVGNTWFKKHAKRRWIWIAPNTRTKNEIVYFLVDTRRILRDASVGVQEARKAQMDLDCAEHKN
ncbi:unnamed protein product [Toxocara canis]|uniref:Endo/exonuclease/phosphatase domain-containing protein n=1 Tax=Toxocara canis TaxID=6265 RepID=A0A183UAT2_TOXCA|nr:unnamed protein product [Toxocara canis]